MHQSFVTHGGYRYAVAPLLMAVACAAGYLAQPSNQQPNGGTWLGLTLGTIAAAMILILMGYGIRRRTFRASVGKRDALALHPRLSGPVHGGDRKSALRLPVRQKTFTR